MHCSLPNYLLLFKGNIIVTPQHPHRGVYLSGGGRDDIIVPIMPVRRGQQCQQGEAVTFHSGAPGVGLAPGPPRPPRRRPRRGCYNVSITVTFTATYKSDGEEKSDTVTISITRVLCVDRQGTITCRPSRR